MRFRYSRFTSRGGEFGIAGARMERIAAAVEQAIHLLRKALKVN